MAKTKNVFVCSNCGYESAKWLGKCPGCNEWNSFYEEKFTKDTKSTGEKRVVKATKLNEVEKMAFDNVLSEQEINILSSIMVYNWFSRNINDVTQFQGHLNNKEFKSHSEAQNLKEKSEYLDRLREKYSQDITDYQLSSLPNSPISLIV